MTLALIGIALIPTIIIFSAVLKKTPTVKKEPFKRVTKVFIKSALSTIIAAILEVIGAVIVVAAYSSDADKIASMSGYFVLCLFVIGPSEEACKYFTFKRNIFNDRQFDHTYDGVVYGAAAALGFATLENVLYVLQYGALTGLFRAVLSVPLHAFTGILMGYNFGISKYIKYNNLINAVNNKNPQRRAFLISVVVHGMFDFLLFATKATDAPENFEYVAIAGVIGIMIFVYVLMFKIINKASKQDLIIYGEYYYQHLNGQIQDMVGKTNEKGAVFVAAGTVPNYTTNTNGYQPNAMSGQPVAWQYGQQANNNYQQPGGYPYGNTQNGQYGYQPHNTYQQPNNVNPYSNNGQYRYPSQNTYQPQQNTYQPQQNGTYGQSYDPVRPMYTPTQAQPQPAETIKFCTECGNRLTTDSKFCPVCGNRI